MPIQTLLMWENDQRNSIGPSAKTLWHSKWVSLYTPEDVEALKKLVAQRGVGDHVGRRRVFVPRHANRGRGRPKMWSADELVERNRLNAQAQYQRKQAEIADERGDSGLAADFRAREDEIRTKLRFEAADRRRKMAGKPF